MKMLKVKELKVQKDNEHNTMFEEVGDITTAQTVLLILFEYDTQSN